MVSRPQSRILRATERLGTKPTSASPLPTQGCPWRASGMAMVCSHLSGSHPPPHPLGEAATQALTHVERVPVSLSRVLLLSSAHEALIGRVSANLLRSLLFPHSVVGSTAVSNPPRPNSLSSFIPGSLASLPRDPTQAASPPTPSTCPAPALKALAGRDRQFPGVAAPASATTNSQGG